MKAELIEKHNETKDVVSFIFKPLESLKWEAGQFIYYKIPHKDPDNRGIIRHFTIASAPHEKNIRLTTRFMDSGGSSFKKALKQLRIDDTVDIFTVEGSFTINKYNDKYAFIAGGIGITPFRAIILDIAENKKIRDIILLYGNRNRELAYKDVLEKVRAENSGLKIQYVISPEIIDFMLLDNKVPDIKDRLCYISGPINMVKSIERSVTEGGISNKMIKTDYFSGY